MRLEHWVYTIPLRLRSLVRGRRVDAELDEELQFHLELKAQEFQAAGMAPEEARLAALRTMDGLTQRKEECRDARRVNVVENAVQDIGYGLRVLAKAPGFTAVAVLTLALGIGANTAIFSVIDRVLLEPLEYPEAERLVQLMLYSPGWAPGQNANSVSIMEFNAMRERRQAFELIAAYGPVKGENLLGVEVPEQLRAMQVSMDYFALFGARPAMGRTFTAEEDRPGGDPVAVLTDGVWRSRFAGDRGVVGRSISLGSGVYQVIGVLGHDFRADGAPEILLPLAADPNSRNGAHGLKATARLRPGVSLAQAREELKAVHRQFLQGLPTMAARASSAQGFTAEPLREVTVGDVRRPLLVLAGAVGLVLLIACANVANLLIARATGRRREIAIRAALGAGRGRIVSQLVTESLLLALLGGALGLAAGAGGVQVLMAIRPASLPRVADGLPLDGAVLAFTLLLSLATGVLFGLLPAFRSMEEFGAGAALSAGRSTASARQNRTRSVLVVAEVAVAIVLLAGAGLLIRTFRALLSVDAGFDARNVLTLEMSLSGTAFEDPAAQGAMVRDAERRLESIPGVVAAAATYSLPLERQLGGILTIDGHPDDRYGTNNAWVSRHYFDVFRIPLRSGRLFTERDDARGPAVGLVNEALAQGRNETMVWSGGFPWSNGDPVGERITMNKGPGGPLEDGTREVAGVVGAVRDAGLNRRPLPMLYLPLTQQNERIGRFMGRDLPFRWVVRTAGDPAGWRAAIERELRAASGGLPLAHVRSMEQVLAASTSRERFQMVLLTVFAAIALLLGAVGVYGLMANAVQQRTREIGIRIALGAGPADVRRMVVREGMGLAVLGVVLGVGGAFELTPLMNSLLFGVKAGDPAVLGAAAGVLMAAALLATYIPARRATGVDPVRALRWE